MTTVEGDTEVVVERELVAGEGGTVVKERGTVVEVMEELVAAIVVEAQK